MMAMIFSSVGACVLLPQLSLPIVSLTPK